MIMIDTVRALSTDIRADIESQFSTAIFQVFIYLSGTPALAAKAPLILRLCKPNCFASKPRELNLSGNTSLIRV